MANIAKRFKDDLQSQGEYVVQANSGWIAVWPNTLRKQNEKMKAAGRTDSCLIVYKDKSEEPRDHHAIPFSVINTFFVEETLTINKSGTEKHWNLSLKNGMLKVTRKEPIDVSRFYGVTLLGEKAFNISEMIVPTADSVEFEQRVQALRRVPVLERPIGQQAPAKHIVAEQTIYERRPDVKAWVLREANGRCELCQQIAPFTGDDGEPYLEVHHVQRLADNGPDIVENTVAVCPGCHRWLHYGIDRLTQRDRLYEQVPRLDPVHSRGAQDKRRVRSASTGRRNRSKPGVPAGDLGNKRVRVDG